MNVTFYKLKKRMNKGSSIKIGRLASSQIQPSSLIFQTLSSSSSLLSTITGGGRGRGCGGVRFIQADPKQSAASNKMADKSNSKNPTDKSHKNLNAMEEAFGEGYSTRSDEEGFGGVYGGNDETNDEQKVIKDPAEHDSSQGSHVEGKEKARNQKSLG